MVRQIFALIIFTKVTGDELFPLRFSLSAPSLLKRGAGWSEKNVFQKHESLEPELMLISNVSVKDRKISEKITENFSLSS